ncbi:hypothetical protein SAY87_006778 [Trapa incisa]|uniref:Pentatricopeptide repeat-containing protein n=1 Tax=Trapa incisa TaxID=236973 RepID=A0AAN7JZ96_9MYRT|nr:hypothetical protein SAY87_006778 [Trapa incisa]
MLWVWYGVGWGGGGVALFEWDRQGPRLFMSSVLCSSSSMASLITANLYTVSSTASAGRRCNYTGQSVRAVPIRILSVGKKRSAGVQLIVDEYIHKLRHYCAVEDIQVRSNPKNARDVLAQVDDEDAAIMSLIRPEEWVVLLDERGMDIRSEELGDLIGDAGNKGVSKISFCVGGPHGHGKKLRDRANRSIKLSSLVLNHQVALIVLMEQLYRKGGSTEQLLSGSASALVVPPLVVSLLRTPLRRRLRSTSMALSISIACGESSPSLFLSAQVFFLRLIDKTFNVFKLNAAEILSLRPHIDPCSRSNSQNELEDLVENFDAEWWLETKNWFSGEVGFGGKGDPQAVYNVLDGLLKGSLERLRTMRERITLMGTSDAACIHQIVYRHHLGTMRKLCAEGKLEAALQLRKNMIQRGVIPDLFSHNYLIGGLCKSGKLDRADSLFGEMLELGPYPNCVTYNIYIKGYCLINNVDKAFCLFSNMVNTGVQPNRITCNILVHALCNRGLVEDAREVLEKIIEGDGDTVSSDLMTSTILMDGYFKSGNMVEALLMWNNVAKEEKKADLVAYNVLVNGFILNMEIKHAFASFGEILKRGFLPDIFTYNTLISGLCKEGKFLEASYIHSVMSKNEIPPDQISFKTIIQGLCIYGDVARANEYLQQMLENSMIPDPLVWNCIIDGYGRTGDINRALVIRDQMLAFGVVPNVFTYNALILAHLKKEDFASAYSLKKEMQLKGVTGDVVTYNILIGSACNLGSISYALQLYDEMLRMGCKPDMITYSELVRGYCNKGQIDCAEDIFTQIVKLGLSGDHVPFKIIFNTYGRLWQHEKALNFYSKWMMKSN